MATHLPYVYILLEVCQRFASFQLILPGGLITDKHDRIMVEALLRTLFAIFDRTELEFKPAFVMRGNFDDDFDFFSLHKGVHIV